MVRLNLRANLCAQVQLEWTEILEENVLSTIPEKKKKAWLLADFAQTGPETRGADFAMK